MSKLRNAPKVLPITPAEPPRPKKDSFGLSASDAFGSGWITHRRGFVAFCGSAEVLSNSAQGSVSSTRVRGDTGTGLGHHRRVGGVNWSKPSTASGSRVQTRKSARCPGGRSTLDVFTRHSPQGHRSSRLHIIAIHNLNRWFWIGTPSLHCHPRKSPTDTSPKAQESEVLAAQKRFGWTWAGPGAATLAARRAAAIVAAACSIKSRSSLSPFGSGVTAQYPAAFSLAWAAYGLDAAAHVTRGMLPNSGRFAKEQPRAQHLLLMEKILL